MVKIVVQNIFEVTAIILHIKRKVKKKLHLFFLYFMKAKLDHYSTGNKQWFQNLHNGCSWV